MNNRLPFEGIGIVLLTVMIVVCTIYGINSYENSKKHNSVEKEPAKLEMFTHFCQVYILEDNKGQLFIWEGDSKNNSMYPIGHQLEYIAKLRKKSSDE